VFVAGAAVTAGVGLAGAALAWRSCPPPAEDEVMRGG
jgi:hypothetical protein